jgi:hypothetical protein
MVKPAGTHRKSLGGLTNWFFNALVINDKCTVISRETAYALLDNQSTLSLRMSS